MGRVYFCEHSTPELVWRPEWQSHPNGARAIARVIVATGEPRRTASLFGALFGADAVAERNGKCVVAAGAARVELTTLEAIDEEFGDAAAEPVDPTNTERARAAIKTLETEAHNVHGFIQTYLAAQEHRPGVR